MKLSVSGHAGMAFVVDLVDCSCSFTYLQLRNKLCTMPFILKLSSNMSIRSQKLYMCLRFLNHKIIKCICGILQSHSGETMLPPKVVCSFAVILAACICVSAQGSLLLCALFHLKKNTNKEYVTEYWTVCLTPTKSSSQSFMIGPFYTAERICRRLSVIEMCAVAWFEA
jgi:hypothetical protein